MNIMMKDINEKFPFYLGYYEYECTDTILHADVYKVEEKIVIRKDGTESRCLDTKMRIEKEDLLFTKNELGHFEVYSKVDPGEHYKNETSVICTSEKDSFMKGENWRGMILKEDEYVEKEDVDIDELLKNIDFKKLAKRLSKYKK